MQIKQQGIRRDWSKQMDKVLKASFKIMSNIEISVKMNLPLSAVRLRLYEHGLRRCDRIKWTEKEKDYLKLNYGIFGDVELSRKMTAEFKRKITKGMVERQMKTLGLSRSLEQIKKIMRNNISGERNPVYKMKPVHQENEIVIRTENNKGGRKTKWIRISGEYIALQRYNYEKFIGPIPAGYSVGFRDKDPLNCEPENLICLSPAEVIQRNRNTEKSVKTYKDKSRGNLNKCKEIMHVITKKGEEYMEKLKYWNDLNSSKYLTNVIKTNEYYEVKEKLEVMRKEIESLKVQVFKMLPINSKFVNKKQVKEIHKQLLNFEAKCKLN